MERSLLLNASTLTNDAKEEAKSSAEKIRDVFEVAVREAWSSTAFAAACTDR